MLRINFCVDRFCFMQKSRHSKQNMYHLFFVLGCAHDICRYPNICRGWRMKSNYFVWVTCSKNHVNIMTLHFFIKRDIFGSCFLSGINPEWNTFIYQVSLFEAIDAASNTWLDKACHGQEYPDIQVKKETTHSWFRCFQYLNFELFEKSRTYKWGAWGFC